MMFNENNKIDWLESLSTGKGYKQKRKHKMPEKEEVIESNNQNVFKQSEQAKIEKILEL